MPDMSLIRVRGTLTSQDMKSRELNVLDAADRSVLLCKASRVANERNRRSDLATSVERMLPATLISSTNS
jgi:hypothetical protein